MASLQKHPNAHVLLLVRPQQRQPGHTLCYYWEGNNSLCEFENYRLFILGQFYAYFFLKLQKVQRAPALLGSFPFPFPLGLTSHSWTTLAPADD